MLSFKVLSVISRFIIVRYSRASIVRVSKVCAQNCIQHSSGVVQFNYSMDCELRSLKIRCGYEFEGWRCGYTVYNEKVAITSKFVQFHWFLLISSLFTKIKQSFGHILGRK